MNITSRIAGDTVTLTCNGVTSTIHIIKVSGSKVRLGIEAPPEIRLGFKSGSAEPKHSTVPCSTLPNPGESV
jgi:hypothetical protein